MIAARLLRLAGALAALLLPAAARAGAFEVQGLGPAGVAEVGARAARADDGTAAFFNPGGLALGEGTRLEASPSLSVSRLSAQGKTLPLEDPFGLSVALSVTIPFEGPLAGRVRIGFAGHFPPRAMHLVMRPEDAPFSPYYDNRTQRLVVMPALGVRILGNLGLGLGLDALAGVRGEATLAAGPTGFVEPRVAIAVPAVYSLHAGLRWDITPRLRLAIAYRQRFGVPVQIKTSADVSGIDLGAEVKTEDAMFDPDTLILATSFDLGRFGVEVDARYQRWSAYAGPLLAVRSSLPGVSLASRTQPGLWRDTAGLRMAGTCRLDLGRRADVMLRLGLGAEPAMMKNAPQRTTKFVDGDKLLVGLGGTFVLRGVVGRALRIGLGASMQAVSDAGQFWTTSLGLGVDL